MTMIVGLDVGVLAAALIGDHAGHVQARATLHDLAIGICDCVVVAPAVVSLIELLRAAGASDEWAAERAHDVRGMCRIVDVSAEDLTFGLRLSRPGVSPRIGVTAAAMTRHGATRVVAFDLGFEAVPGLARVTPGDDLLSDAPPTDTAT